MNTYTLIANKPESADYCKCCLMESYPGDFQIHQEIPKDELIQHAAKYASIETARAEADYSLAIIISTSTGAYFTNISGDMFSTSPELYDNAPQFANPELAAEWDSILMEINAKVKQIKSDRETARAQEKATKIAKELAAKEARELAEFQRLQMKYTTPTPSS